MDMGAFVLLVSFYTPTIDSLMPQHLQTDVVKASDAVAVRLESKYWYDAESEDTDYLSVLLDQTRQTRQSDKIAPWIFFNRFVGAGEKSHPNMETDSKEHYSRYHALEIQPNSTARKSFESILEKAIEISKLLGSNGIVIDPEAYNNYRAYSIRHVATELSISEDDLKARLTNFGRDLGKRAEEAFGDQGWIWFLYTGLEDLIPDESTAKVKDARTVSYIIRGMVLQLSEMESPVKVFSGGEKSFGYCHESSNKFQQELHSRMIVGKEVSKHYSNVSFAIPIAPWYDLSQRSRFMIRRDVCRESSISNASEFGDMLNYSRRYKVPVWIYAAYAAPFDPHNKLYDVHYRPFIRQILSPN